MNNSIKIDLNAKQIQHDLNWENPEEVYHAINNTKIAVRTTIESMFEDCDAEKIEFVYANYDFLENQIQQFLEQDYFTDIKSAWVIRQYFKDLIGEVTDNLEGDWYDPEHIGRRCTEPEFGSTNDWISFVDAMIEMYKNGMTQKVEKEIKNIKYLQYQYLNK